MTDSTTNVTFADIIAGATPNQQFRLNEWLVANHPGTDPTTIDLVTVEDWFGDTNLDRIMGYIMQPINDERRQREQATLTAMASAPIRVKHSNWLNELLTSPAAQDVRMATVVGKLEAICDDPTESNRLQAVQLSEAFRAKAWRLGLDATPSMRMNPTNDGEGESEDPTTGVSAPSPDGEEAF